MPNFQYKAKDPSGNDIKGLVEAKDKKLALSILREKGYFPYLLKDVSSTLLSTISKKIKSRVSIADIATFTRQLSTMVNAGLPLTESLVILKTQGKPMIIEVANSALRDVQAGSTLADALKKFPKVFSSVYIALVKAGEAAGVLDKILARLADNLEAQREFKAKIKGALMYPMIIMVGMIGVMIIMMIFVIPKLTSLYTEFNATLPKPTEILIGISTFMIKFWWLLGIAAFGVYTVLKTMLKNKKTRRKFDEIKFKLPIFGILQKRIVLAEFTRTLSLLISSGVSIIEALEISSKTADNLIIQEAIIEANKQVEKGYPLALSISQNPVFPQILSQMLSVGEETGKTDEVLMKVSKFFQSESEESLKGLTTAIEPLIMILLGAGVGFLIIAIVLPIYNLSTQFQ